MASMDKEKVRVIHEAIHRAMEMVANEYGLRYVGSALTYSEHDVRCPVRFFLKGAHVVARGLGSEDMKDAKFVVGEPVMMPGRRGKFEDCVLDGFHDQTAYVTRVSDGKHFSTKVWGLRRAS